MCPPAHPPVNRFSGPGGTEPRRKNRARDLAVRALVPAIAAGDRGASCGGSAEVDDHDAAVLPVVAIVVIVVALGALVAARTTDRLGDRQLENGTIVARLLPLASLYLLDDVSVQHRASSRPRRRRPGFVQAAFPLDPLRSSSPRSKRCAPSSHSDVPAGPWFHRIPRRDRGSRIGVGPGERALHEGSGVARRPRGRASSARNSLTFPPRRGA
ncbi:hypothetical protein Anae109_2169 [Anaeromyxobacter sp. Fw109-5]|nr:hypothetical protein Anae109_2169 [Anaeromyxobacter sp. Fw109-5]